MSSSEGEVAWKNLLDREVALAAREKKMLEERVSSLLQDLTHERERVRELEKLLSLYTGKALSSVSRGGGAGASSTLPSSPGPPGGSTPLVGSSHPPNSPPSQEFCDIILKLLAGTSEDTALVATTMQVEGDGAASAVVAGSATYAKAICVVGYEQRNGTVVADPLLPAAMTYSIMKQARVQSIPLPGRVYYINSALQPQPPLSGQGPDFGTGPLSTVFATA
jgi:hypothetical protein